MKLTAHTFVTLDGVMQGPGGPDEDTTGGFNAGVVSTTLTDPTWQGTSVISADVVDAVRALKAQPGRELQVHGSCALLHGLHDAGLIDEYRLIVFPVVLGTGKRLFAEGSAPTGFTLVDSEVTGSGAVYQVLRPAPLATGDIVVEDGREVIV